MWWEFLFEWFYLLSENREESAEMRVGRRCWRLAEREGKKLSRREGD